MNLVYKIFIKVYLFKYYGNDISNEIAENESTKEKGLSINENSNNTEKKLINYRLYRHHTSICGITFCK